jgi:hypothetical protein
MVSAKPGPVLTLLSNGTWVRVDAQHDYASEFMGMSSAQQGRAPLGAGYPSHQMCLPNFARPTQGVAVASHLLGGMLWELRILSRTRTAWCMSSCVRTAVKLASHLGQLFAV